MNAFFIFFTLYSSYTWVDAVIITTEFVMTVLLIYLETE